jgi:hypothetical protein
VLLFDNLPVRPRRRAVIMTAGVRGNPVVDSITRLGRFTHQPVTEPEEITRVRIT